jgi:hypothetical protein
MKKGSLVIIKLWIVVLVGAIWYGCEMSNLYDSCCCCTTSAWHSGISIQGRGFHSELYYMYWDMINVDSN